MQNHLKEIIWNQLGAAIDMLDNAIVACPEQVWSGKSTYHDFWYIAYHTIFYLDHYLSEQEEGFTPPPPYTLSEFDPAGILPDRVYSKEELRGYIDYCRMKLRSRLNALTSEELAAPCGFTRRNFSVAELFFYNMRHVQHHAAQLNLILRQTTDSAPNWVGRTKQDLESL